MKRILAIRGWNRLDLTLDSILEIYISEKHGHACYKTLLELTLS